VTGALHFQLHPCAAKEPFVDPLPEDASREGYPYPDGVHITDLKEVRDPLYKIQRPAIAPGVRICFVLPPPPWEGFWKEEQWKALLKID
jgi:hypothetical protein